MASRGKGAAGRWLAWLGLACVLCLRVAPAAVGEAGLQTDVVFDHYFALSGTGELQRRLLSPLQAWRVDQAVAKSGQRLREQSIDLAQETFMVYVPATKPVQGYALLVFEFPWNHPNLPARWSEELDRRGMIFVSPAGAGNDQNLLNRREPLALLAAHNILQRYPVDPARVYIGGLSGGSRVALRLALAYPDLFHGALLNAGSGPFGNAKIPLPPADLLHRFQENSRVVFITGENDKTQLGGDVQGRISMQNGCAFDYATVTVPWLDHDLLPAPAFGRGLDALETPDTPPAAKIAACRARHEQELDARLSEAEALQAAGRTAAAARMLDEIDVRFGGLSAPRSIDLARRIGQ